MTDRELRVKHLSDVDCDILPERLREAMNDAHTCKFVMSKDGVCRSSTTLSYLCGERLPNGRTLLYLCNYLNVSADWLLGLSDEKKPIWT